MSNETVETKQVLEFKKSQGRAFRQVRYLALAACKDVARYNLTFIKVCEPDSDGKVMAVSTDGRRMHFAHDIDYLEPGYYRIEKNTKTTVILESFKDFEGTYPNWEMIVPKDFEWNPFKGDIQDEPDLYDVSCIQWEIMHKTLTNVNDVFPPSTRKPQNLPADTIGLCTNANYVQQALGSSADAWGLNKCKGIYDLSSPLLFGESFESGKNEDGNLIADYRLIALIMPIRAWK